MTIEELAKKTVMERLKGGIGKVDYSQGSQNCTA